MRLDALMYETVDGRHLSRLSTICLKLLDGSQKSFEAEAGVALQEVTKLFLMQKHAKMGSSSSLKRPMHAVPQAHLLAYNNVGCDHKVVNLVDAGRQNIGKEIACSGHDEVLERRNLERYRDFVNGKELDDFCLFVEYAAYQLSAENM